MLFVVVLWLPSLRCCLLFVLMCVVCCVLFVFDL